MDDQDPPRGLPANHGGTYGRRFVIFQLAKYVCAVALLSLLGVVWSSVRGSTVQLVASIATSAALAYVAFRMLDQYRCPRCAQLLIFAHGSSGSSGGSTRSDACPFCGARLT